jgi:pyruvate kinase
MHGTTRKTKIIATLGPATDSREMLGKLIDAGMNIARLNLSHAKPEWVLRVSRDIRELAAQRGTAIGILLDLKGPGIRTGDVAAPIPLLRGERFIFTCGGEPAPTDGTKWTSVAYLDFARDVEVGKTLIVDNGEMKMHILSKSELRVECEVLTDGSLGSRRHINLPGVRVSLPALTAKDREDVKLGLAAGVDFIALSFVREPSDLADLRSLVAGAKHPPALVAKIEHEFAVHNFEAIAKVADGIMVARGDLGIECPYEELPIIQRRIVKRCAQIGRPVIVATHMLESMIENPLPTRAEITDVANAVFEQADAIMLSGETTVGKHPLACLEVMDTIARRIERSGGAGYHEAAEVWQSREKLVQSAVKLADQLRTAALIVFTKNGELAQYAGWFRPKTTPVFAFCEQITVARQLALVRGVVPLFMPACPDDLEGSLSGAIRRLKQLGSLHSGDTIVAIMPNASADDSYADAVTMRPVA